MRSATVRLPGHPDAICDYLAEAIVDEYLRRDIKSRVRCTVHGGAGAIFVSGDVFSSADFDVSRLLQQKLGELGVTEEIEIFVALETRTIDQKGSQIAFQSEPVHVVGCAFSETEEQVPETVVLSRRIAKRLDDLRKSNPDWFWLGSDGSVTVLAELKSPSHIFIDVEHGEQPLDTIRQNVQEGLKLITTKIPIFVNTAGPREKRGFEFMSGVSGRTPSCYGSLVPELPVYVGRDINSVEKAGTWLARYAAKQLCKSEDVKAVWVRAVYTPGEERPSHLRILDEKGQALSSEVVREFMDVSLIVREWWRPNLNTEAIKWGFAGELSLPWEN